MPHDQQTIEQTERDCRNDEQVYRGDAVGMIAEERLLPLGRRTSSLGNVFSHTRLSDRDVEFQQLSMDPWPHGLIHGKRVMGPSEVSRRRFLFLRMSHQATANTKISVP
jgi:hypothetical protein